MSLWINCTILKELKAIELRARVIIIQWDTGISMCACFSAIMTYSLDNWSCSFVSYSSSLLFVVLRASCLLLTCSSSWWQYSNCFLVKHGVRGRFWNTQEGCRIRNINVTIEDWAMIKNCLWHYNGTHCRFMF